MNNDVIIRYFKGELNSDEVQAFLEWVNQDPSHLEQLNKLKQAWVLSSVIKGDFDSASGDEYELFKYRRDRLKNNSDSNRRLRIISWVAGIAASFLVFMGVYWIFSRDSKQPEDAFALSHNEIITKAGEKSKVVLADGSVIWVNACTRLKYPVRLDGSVVEYFLEGEAFFDFRKKEGRQIVVHTSQINVKVLGTAFNLRSYADEDIIETTLVRGAVEIENQAPAKKASGHIVRLEPNQSATFIKSDNSSVVSTFSEKSIKTDENIENVISVARINNANMIVAESVNVDLKSSWKDGKLNFKGETFLQLAKIFERWYDVKIIIKDEKLKDKKLTGTFEKETIVQALEALSYPVPFNYQVKKDTVFITAK